MRGVRVDWFPLVGHLCHISIDGVSGVAGGLDPSIRQCYHIGALHMPLKLCFNKNIKKTF